MSKIKVLAVEDELPIRCLIEAKLTAAGYEVETATNGEEGLEILASFKPDLIISDYNMPGKLNGLEMIRSLRQEEYGKEIPVILLTGSISVVSGLLEEAERLSKVVYLSKPFSPRKLVLVVEENTNKRDVE